jgi:hypothetical protein
MTAASQALRAFLEAGRMPAAEGHKRMRAAGYSEHQTRKASRALGVVATLEGYGGVWWWELPDGTCRTCGHPLAPGPKPDRWPDRSAPGAGTTSGGQRAAAGAPRSAHTDGPAVCSICRMPGLPGRCTGPLRDPSTGMPVMGGRGRCAGYVQ